jgi:hypothetical protein
MVAAMNGVFGFVTSLRRYTVRLYLMSCVLCVDSLAMINVTCRCVVRCTYMHVNADTTETHNLFLTGTCFDYKKLLKID